ncbi:hypothetical protein ATK78_1365 [Pedobacter metabolipauper]|uniref:Uncharacterized protein n=2 Tax=Pedobacter metabolipauper TaxID=425513 RepID=A0A4R6SV19_9SPHI|nr:hypothetical protein ATK78_1365 [Pedobacter metabolipauper]
MILLITSAAYAQKVDSVKLKQLNLQKKLNSDPEKASQINTIQEAYKLEVELVLANKLLSSKEKLEKIQVLVEEKNKKFRAVLTGVQKDTYKPVVKPVTSASGNLIH